MSVEIETRERSKWRPIRLYGDWCLTINWEATDFGLGIALHEIRPLWILAYLGRYSFTLRSSFVWYREPRRRFIGRQFGKHPNKWGYNLGIHSLPFGFFFHFERPLGCIDWQFYVGFAWLYFILSQDREFRWPGTLVQALRGSKEVQ